MRRFSIICILVLVLSLTRAEQKAEVQKSQVTKLEVVDFSGAEIGPNPKQPDVQRKRDSGSSYNKPSRISLYSRLRFQANQPRDQIASRNPSQINRPFTRYGPPNHSNPSHEHRVQQHRNKLQHHVSPQQSISHDAGDQFPTQQEVPSPIRNVDFAELNPIASQNNEPFGMHTANYLPPQNQKLPAHSSTDSFSPESQYSPPGSPGHGQVQSTGLPRQNLVQPENHQISDAALFLSQNAQAIQQLYGAPASNQDFAPSRDQFQDSGNHIQNPNSQFGNLAIASPGFPQEFPALPPYASGTLSPQETLEQIQSLEKDRLIVQLQQALAQTQSNPSADLTGRYAQHQASFVQNQELLASISQQMKSHVSTAPQSVAFASGGNTAFSQSPFLPGTTVDPLRLPLSYGIPTTAQTPTTTTVAAAPSRPPQSSDGTTQVASSLPAPNQPGPPTTSSPVGIPVYRGFVPTWIAGTNFFPSYSTSIFASGPIRPAQLPGSSPTHFGLPIPTESPQKPASGQTPLIPTSTPSVTSDRPPGVALAPAITPVVLPIQPLRPVAATPLHPVTTPAYPVAPLHPALPANPAHPVQTTPAATSSSAQHPYFQTALINPVLYKPLKTVYPLYYYSNVVHQLQKPAVPSYPWSYAPSYVQAKPAQIWK